MPPPASNWRRLLLIQNFTCKLKLKRSLTELYISVIITLRKKLEMHWQNRNAFWTSNNNFHSNWYLQNKISYYIYIYIYVSHTHVCCCCSCCCCCCFCLNKNSTSCKNFKMLQFLTDIHNFQCPSFKLQNSIYIFDLNIVAFQTFFVSCFGQWRMPLRVGNMYRGLHRTFLVPDTLQSYTSLGPSYTIIVSSFADH